MSVLNTLLMNVGERIEQERRAIGISRKSFSAAIGISERHYRRIRTGADISHELLLNICTVTDRDPNYFLLPPEGNPFSSRNILPGTLQKLIALPPWAFQPIIAALRELEKICRNEK